MTTSTARHEKCRGTQAPGLCFRYGPTLEPDLVPIYETGMRDRHVQITNWIIAIAAVLALIASTIGTWHQLALTNEALRATERQLVLTERTLEVTEKELAATETALRTTERAWLAPTAEVISGTDKVKLTFTNAGGGPAHNIFVDFDEKPRPVDDTTAERERHEKEIVGRYLNESIDRTKSGQSTSVLAPGAPITREFPIANWEQVKKKEKLLFVGGRADYEDVFGKRHWTSFCLIYLRDSNAFASCTQGNKAN